MCEAPTLFQFAETMWGKSEWESQEFSILKIELRGAFEEAAR
jgi:hypothetical protein